MSILNGAISGDLIHGTSMPYGEPMKELSFTALSGCFHVQLSQDGQYLYAACRGELRIYKIEAGKSPCEIGRLEGIGASRQMAIANGYAYISARSGGLYIADVHNPWEPQLIGQIDSLELATGVCAWENLCLITNRHMGVEIWDVSDPKNPRYLSSFLAGEAQSVDVDGGFAYAGDWMNRRVHVVDIRDTENPKKVATFQVDGYADGVFVRDGLCLVASGHHSAKLKNRREYEQFTYLTQELLESGYGQGNGLTLYDVSDPEAPAYLSEVKFPPLYSAACDTWLVTGDGQHAYVSNSFNGVFAVDISDRLHPFTAAYFQLPLKEGTPSLFPVYVQSRHQPITCVACSEGKLYAAGPESGLHELKFDQARKMQPAAPSVQPPQQLKFQQIFQCNGQVHSLVEKENCLLLACGSDGFYALEAHGYQVLHHLKTEGIAHDIALYKDCVCTAEGRMGIGMYTFSRADGFQLLSRYDFPGDSVRQVVALPEQDKIAAETNVTQVSFFTVDHENVLHFEISHSNLGMLYHRHLHAVMHPDGYICAQSLARGPVWLNVLDTTQPGFNTPELKSFCPIEEGIAIQDRNIFMIRNRRFGICEAPEKMSDTFQGKNFCIIPGAKLAGQPFALKDQLVLVNRVTGYVERLNIQVPEKPVLTDAAVVSGNPELAIWLNGKSYIACGHGGLILILP